MAQTAVEWLEKEIKEWCLVIDTVTLQSAFEKAKHFEKQQIMDAYGEGKTNGMDISHPLSLTEEIFAGQYYNETFNK